MLEKSVVGFLNKTGGEFTSTDISTCHTLGKPTNGNKRMIVVRSINCETKDNIPRKKMKAERATGMFVNEHLSKRLLLLSRPHSCPTWLLDSHGLGMRQRATASVC